MQKPTPIDEEIQLDPKRYIVSETDEKGKIIFCNDYFMEVAGYSKEELTKTLQIVYVPELHRVAFVFLDVVQLGCRCYAALLHAHRA